MIFGFTNAYVGFVTYIQLHDPLPIFFSIKSKLELWEINILQRENHDSSSSTLTSLVDNSTPPTIDLPLHLTLWTTPKTRLLHPTTIMIMRRRTIVTTTKTIAHGEVVGHAAANNTHSGNCILLGTFHHVLTPSYNWNRPKNVV